MLRIHWVLVLALALGAAASTAFADSLTFSGNMTSDGTAVSSTDPVISDPSTIVYGDAFTLTFTYDPAQYTHSGASYVFTDASLSFALGGNSFSYSSAAGNYLAMYGAPYGPGTVSFQFCSSLAGCSTDDFLNLYYSGSVTDPSTLAAQAGGLSGYASASPSQFEFLRNFSDGSQTDLQGTLGSVTGQTSPANNSVPEPATITLLAAGMGAGLLRRTRKS